MTDLGTLIDPVQKIVRATTPITHGSQPDRYLRSRGIYLDTFPTDLRDHNGNMLAIIRDHVYGIGVSCQWTVLKQNEDGTFDKNRFMKKDLQIPDGAAIRLGPALKCMGVAEGTEDALSASALQGVPVWSAVSAVGMEKWRPPKGIKHLYIFGDNDKVGIEAANKLVARAIDNDIIPHVKIQAHHKDWNQFLMGTGKLDNDRLEMKSCLSL